MPAVCIVWACPRPALSCEPSALCERHTAEWCSEDSADMVAASGWQGYGPHATDWPEWASELTAVELAALT